MCIRDSFDAERETVLASRGEVAPQIGEALMTLYAKVRESSGGIGAAELKQRRCGGCRLELNSLDLSSIRSAAADDVVRCEECRRILIRTAESGL